MQPGDRQKKHDFQRLAIVFIYQWRDLDKDKALKEAAHPILLMCYCAIIYSVH